MIHSTLNTGDSRRCPRSEVGEDIIAALKPLIAQGGGYVTESDISVAITRQGGGACFTIFEGEKPLVNCSMAWDKDSQDYVWSCAERLYLDTTEVAQRATGAWSDAIMAEPIMPDELPWLAVVLLPSLFGTRRETLAMLGDMERCIAWAILDTYNNGE